MLKQLAISTIVLIILIVIPAVCITIYNFKETVNNKRKEKLLKSYGFYKSRNGQYWKYEDSIIVPDILWCEVKYSTYKELKEFIEKERLYLLKDKER